MKPGYKTTEFYVAVVSGLGMIAIAFGILSKADLDNLTQALTGVVGAVGALLIAIKPIVAYIESRADVKASAEYSK